MNNMVINEYLMFIVETLSDWTDGAMNILNIAAATVTSLTKRRLKNINTAIIRLKEDFKVLFEAYKEIEKEYELKPFAFEYYNAYAKHITEVRKILENIKKIAEGYQHFIEESKKENIVIESYITPANQNSIEFLMHLNEDDLLKIISEGHLAGL